MLRVLFLYLLLVNLLAYGICWLDKRRARSGGPRIPESELLLWALAGGSVGALLGRRRFRHETRKRSYRLALYGVVLLQAVAIWLVVRA